MKDECREFLQDSGTESSGLSRGVGELRSSPTFGMRKKGWLALFAAMGLIACVGTAAALRTKNGPLPTLRGAKPTTLVQVVDQREGICSTGIHLEERLHQNLGNKGPDSGVEGLILKGTYTFEGNSQPIEVHFHALTDFELPLAAYEGTFYSDLKTFREGNPPGHLAIIRMRRSWMTKFKVEFVLPGSDHQLVTLPRVAVTFFDIDGHGPGCEKIDFEPANEVVMAVGKQVDVDMSKKDAGIVKFTNTGLQVPLPPSIDSFESIDQRQHAAEIVFYQKSSFNVTLQTGPPCGDRDFAYVFQANVECAPDAEGNAPPPVDIETAEPIPLEPRYCMGCLINGHFGFVPPCVDHPAWWARPCF